MWAACGCQACISLWSLQRNCPKTEESDNILGASGADKRLEGKEKICQERWLIGANECFILGRNSAWVDGFPPPGLHLAQWEADIFSIPTCGEKAVDARAHTTFSSFKSFKEEPDAWLAVGKPVRS